MVSRLAPLIIISVLIHLTALFECFLWYVGFVNTSFDISVNKHYMNSRGHPSAENNTKNSMLKDFCTLVSLESSYM